MNMLENNPYIKQLLDGIQNAEERYFEENKIYKKDYFMKLPDWVADPFQIVGIGEVEGLPYEKTFVVPYEPISNNIWNLYVIGNCHKKDTEFDKNKKYKEIVVCYGENTKEYFEDCIVFQEINNESRL